MTTYHELDRTFERSLINSICSLSEIRLDVAQGFMSETQAINELGRLAAYVRSRALNEDNFKQPPRKSNDVVQLP